MRMTRFWNSIHELISMSTAGKSNNIKFFRSNETKEHTQGSQNLLRLYVRQTIIYEYTQLYRVHLITWGSQTDYIGGNTCISRQLPYDGDDHSLFCWWSVIIYSSSEYMQKLNWGNEYMCSSFSGCSYLVVFPLYLYRCLFVSVSSICPQISLYLGILYSFYTSDALLLWTIYN